MLTLLFCCFQFVLMRGGYIVFVILGIVRGVRGGEGWVDEREDRGGEGWVDESEKEKISELISL